MIEKYEICKIFVNHSITSLNLKENGCHHWQSYTDCQYIGLISKDSPILYVKDPEDLETVSQ